MSTQNQHKLSKVIKDVEDELGHEFSEREQKFSLHVVTHPGESNAEAARQAGAPEASARQRATEMAGTPEVQLLIERLRQEIGNVDDIDVKSLVKSTLVKEVLHATHSRDRQSAAVNLGRTQGMFTDVLDQTTRADRSDLEILKEARGKYTDEAYAQAWHDMGYESDPLGAE